MSTACHQIEVFSRVLRTSISGFLEGGEEALEKHLPEFTVRTLCFLCICMFFPLLYAWQLTGCKFVFDLSQKLMPLVSGKEQSKEFGMGGGGGCCVLQTFLSSFLMIEFECKV